MEEASVKAAVDFAAEKWGRINGSVCCAGGGAKGTGTTVNRKGEAHNMEAFENTVKLNVVGTFSVCSKAAVRHTHPHPF